MSLTLQLLHALLFVTLAFSKQTNRRVMLALAASGLFYMLCQINVWPMFKEYPYGIVIHAVKFLTDLTVGALLVAWSIKSPEAFRKYYTNTMFAFIQAGLLWLMAGLNLVAALEFPFLKYFSYVYDAYPSASHGLNIAQLLTGVFYGLFIASLHGFGRDGIPSLVRSWRSTRQMGHRKGQIK